MGTVNRVRLAVLFLTVGVLCAASPALADKHPVNPQQTSPYLTTTERLVPPAIDPPEPLASGKGVIECYVWSVPTGGDGSAYYLSSSVTVTCMKLTPGKQYHVCWLGEESGLGSCPTTADGKGRLRAEFSVQDWCWGVWVENDAGAVVLMAED